MINTKGTPIAGAILGYTIIDTATLRPKKSFLNSLWFGFVNQLVAASIVGIPACMFPCDQTIVEAAVGIRYVPTERYKTWKKKTLPRIKKIEPNDAKGAVLLTSLFAVMGAVMMFAFFSWAAHAFVQVSRGDFDARRDPVFKTVFKNYLAPPPPQSWWV